MIYFPDNIPLPTVANTSDARASGLRVAETLAGVPRVERSWGTPPIVKSFTWVLDRNHTALLYRFWKVELLSGSKEFEIKLDGASQFAEPYRIKLLPDGWQSSNESGVFSIVVMRGIVYDAKKALVSFLYPFYFNDSADAISVKPRVAGAELSALVKRKGVSDNTSNTLSAGSVLDVTLKTVTQRSSTAETVDTTTHKGSILSVVVKNVVVRSANNLSVSDELKLGGDILEFELNQISRINLNLTEPADQVSVSGGILDITLGA